MDATTTVARREWLCLLFFLPAKHGDARVRAWRRLQRLGAVLLKNAAYALPASPESREDFEWIRQEIVGSGGQAMVLVALAPDKVTEDEIVAAFRAARRRDFEALAADGAALLKMTGPRTRRNSRQLTQGIRRLRERFEEKAAVDFFDSPEREQVAALLRQLDERTGRRRAMDGARKAAASPADYRDKVWVTRPRPGVDRMSSAWLIRRFIDANARFAFGPPASLPAAVPFDTFEAEFGHHGTHCTFETFCDRFAIKDPSVQHIGRIVHDLDLKEATYQEPETVTIGRLVEGLRRARHEDEALLRSGIEMFEALYQSLASGDTTTTAAAERRRPRRSSRGRSSKDS